MCIVCWKERKGFDLTKGDIAFRELATVMEARVTELEQQLGAAEHSLIEMDCDGGGSLDGNRLMDLIQLCHPDRHKGSALSTRITKWLLDLRDRMRSDAA